MNDEPKIHYCTPACRCLNDWPSDWTVVLVPADETAWGRGTDA